MKHRGIGLGLFLLTLGVLWGLFTLGIVDWWVLNSLLVLWPLIFVVIGVNIIFKKYPIARAITWMAFLTILLVHSYYFSDRKSPMTNANGTLVVEDKLPETKTGEVNLKLGAVTFNVNSNTEKLFEANIPEGIVKSKAQYNQNKEVATVELERKGRVIFPFNKVNQYCGLDLNRDVIWDMNLDVGAVNGELDMSELKVRTVDLNMGVGDMKLEFGNRYDNTDVTINAGVSTIELIVPKDVGIRVRLDGGVNKTNLSDLDWARVDGYYVSPAFDAATSKINVNVDMGVSKLTVTQK